MSATSISSLHSLSIVIEIVNTNSMMFEFVYTGTHDVRLDTRLDI